ncbi:MFS transporter [Shimia sp.]|uniref:MFS transporter n=1 Tax=Shimia sp. TaxID=1954381 RepID=UPI00356AE5B9
MNFAALKSANFRIYLGGSFLGLLSLWMQRVTSGWLAWEMTGSTSFVGLVAMVQFAPSIVLSPLFGVWADRLNLKRAALAVQGVNLAIALGFLALAALGGLTPLPLVLLSLFSGITAAANHPVRMSLTPRLVRRERIGSVVNLVAINFNVGRMVGPALGGALIAKAGIVPALAVQAALYLPYVLALTRLTLRPRRDAGLDHAPFFRALAGGLRHVWQTPLIWRAMVIVAVLSPVARGTLEILPPLADGVFGRGAGGLGTMLSTAGIGAVLGGLTKGLLPPQTPGRMPWLSLVFVLIGLALVPLLGVVRVWEQALAIVGGLAFVTTLVAISMQTAIQLELDDDMRGRVMSLWAVVAAGGSALGAGILGLLADAFGYGATLLGAGSAAGAGLGLYFAFIAARR